MSLILANAAKRWPYDFLGSPEGEIALAQLTIHLATAPKSNAVYRAYGGCDEIRAGNRIPDAACSHPQTRPPSWMKDLGYGRSGYAYDHDQALRSYLRPDLFPRGHGIARRSTRCKGDGAEARIKERLDRWTALRKGAWTALSRRPQRPERSSPPGIKLTPDEIAFVRGLVIYEDPDILALNKPAGLSSQGGRGQVHTLDELLWAFARPWNMRGRG